MTLSIYLNIQQVIMGAILALGCQLILGNIPQELKGSPIHHSSRVMGVALTILPIVSFIYYFSDLRYAGAQYATAINLSGYCVTSTMVSMAYYILLGKVDNKPILGWHLISGLLYPFPLWIGLCYGSEVVAKQILIIFYTIFCVFGIVHISTCWYFYRQKLRTHIASTNRSPLQNIEMKLLGRLIYVSFSLVIVSLCSPSFFTYPMWLGAIFIMIFVVVFIHTYICYHKILSSNINYLIKLDQPSSEREAGADSDHRHHPTKVEIASNSNEVTLSIEANIQQWLKKKEFLNAGISITSVAKATCTNRTYLSRYINSVYKCSFKSWITQLRIEEAKELIKSRSELSISDIAIQTGFASVESFSHIFTRYEELSPSKWREQNREGKYKLKRN